MRVRESEIYYRLFSFATNPRESDWSPNEIKRKMIDLWKLIRQTDFGPSPRRVREESERVRNHRFLYRKNRAHVTTVRCCSIKMCPGGPSFSHQHRKPNLKWISSLSESDRLEIHLRFVFGQRAPSTMLVTAGLSTPESPPYNIIRAKRCESPRIWNLLSVILVRDESERVRLESERNQKRTLLICGNL